MTLSQFAEIFALLAVQLRQTDADEATVRGYFETLKDLEPEFLALAAKRFANSAEWFPKTSEWRSTARVIEHERGDALRAILRKLPAPLCSACDDTGWMAIHAENQPRRVRPCPCQRIRRLEILGRRPWPTLPDVTADPTQETRVMQLVEPVVRDRRWP